MHTRYGKTTWSVRSLEPKKDPALVKKENLYDRVKAFYEAGGPLTSYSMEETGGHDYYNGNGERVGTMGGHIETSISWAWNGMTGTVKLITPQGNRDIAFERIVLFLEKLIAS